MLYVIDAVKGPSEEDRRFEDKLRAGSARIIEVYNKCDLAAQTLKEEENRIFLSALTGSGHGRLKRVLASLAAQANSSEGLLITSARHNAALERALEALKGARAGEALVLDCASIDLRTALSALEEITGQSASEGMVERIFERFCLGK